MSETGEQARRKLVDRYREARQMWRENPAIQAAAETLGMSEYEYCSRVLSGYRATVLLTIDAATEANYPTTHWLLDHHAAFREAGE